VIDAAVSLDPDFLEAQLREILQETGSAPENLVAILRRIQDRYRFLPRSALQRLSDLTSIPPSRIEGVATFYTSFRRTPAGRHRIQVCIGTACFVKGADQVLEAFRDTLGLAGESDTDKDGRFTLETTACLGCCMLAPVARIDQVIVGHLERQQVPRLLESVLRTQGSASNDGSLPAPVGPRCASIRLCTCSSCRASGAAEVFEELEREVRTWGLQVSVQRSGCSGISYRAPMVEVVPRAGEPARYAGITIQDVPSILLRHFRSPRPGVQAKRIFSLALDRIMQNRLEQPSPMRLEQEPDRAFWGRQVRIVTEDTGRDPLDLDGYVESGGFTALQACRGSRTPDQVIALIEASGLRGRGGAGYPTGRKWRDVRSSPGRPKSLICNADEGDPGAFMDRLVLESYPFRVIEGAAIAAFAVGAARCVFYVRTEYPLAVARLSKAIDACRSAGVLEGEWTGLPGPPVFQVVEGAGAFVCGEETAMIAAIGGMRGSPRSRPPYPAVEGLDGKPTLVNNVETLAAVPWIIRNGAQAFRAIGTRASPGTKTFALAGKVRRGGLIEVPMGMSLREMIEEIGGGVQEKRTLKAVQIGGPSGGCIPAAMTDIVIDYESLSEAGAMMGSGGMVVLDDTDCMVNVARYFLSFTQRESCGACTGCRVGTRLMHQVLDDLCSGAGRPADVKRLEELARAVQVTSLCGLGRSAPNPVLSTLRYFRGEYDEHARGSCPAGQCRKLFAYTITDACIGCTRCAQRCPTGAVTARPYERHVIDPSLCIRCGTCRLACPSDAVAVVTREACLA
jgi:NADH-quinone oxidoreductase subunit F